MAACSIPEILLSNKAGHFKVKRGLFVFSQPLLKAYYDSRDHYLEMNKFLKVKLKTVCACSAQVTYVANNRTCCTPRTPRQSLINYTELSHCV